MPVTAAFQSKAKLGRSYLRAPVALRFPVDQEMPEGGVHLELRTGLYLILRGEFAGRAFIGSEQFLYWDPTDPKKCLAPDVMVRLQGPDLPLPCLKVWEGGAPQLAVEIVSPSENSAKDWDEKLERYRQSGVAEVVRFDPERPDHPLRLWDRLEGDLVERVLDGPAGLRCDALGLYWHYRSNARLGCVLRLARDPDGQQLLPVPEECGQWEGEQERAAKEQERAAKEQERAAKEQERAAKEAALLRVAELEAELRRR